MTEKRFVYYEHKGADYILDAPNKSLDFIEMLGDCLEAEEIVDLLNKFYEENKGLKLQLDAFKDKICELGVSDAKRYDKRFHIAISNDNTVRLIDHERNNDLISIGFKKHSDAADCSDVLQYLCNLMNRLAEENEQLKQQLKSIEDSFKFSCTENHIEFNKDTLKVEDAHTELTLKDGKLCISVFIPQLNEYVKFFYLVTGRKMGREFINYEGDVE